MEAVFASIGAIAKKVSALEKRVTALETAGKQEKTEERKVDELVADIVEDAGVEIDDEEGNHDAPSDGEVVDADEEPRGPILQRPHQFTKLASLDAENKNINAFLANPTKVKIEGCFDYIHVGKSITG